jgi:galactonate dehydratase
VTMPNFATLEYAFGEVDWRENLVQAPESIVDGFYTPPDGPGLGLRLNPEVAAAHAP